MKAIKLILVAPSGSGKTTIANYIAENYSMEIAKSFTTRLPRNSEDNEYHFITKEKFQQLKNDNFFFETEEIFGNFYGTPISYIETSKDIIFNVDVHGMERLKEYMPTAVSLMILPPSIEILTTRLQKRNHHEDLSHRISRISKELSYKTDFTLVNEDLEVTFQYIQSLIFLLHHEKIGHNVKKQLLS